MPRPADPVALVTGATGGLGRAVAATFHDDGYRLALGGTDPTKLDTLARDLLLDPDRWVAAVGDLTTPEGAREAVDAVVDRFGRIDAWLHVVGGWAGGTSVVDLDPGEVRGMLDQHLWSTLHLAQRIVPGMMQTGWGRIVAVSTPFAMTPGPRGASYAVAKGAQDTLIRALARELGGTGVTANLVVVRKIDAAGERESDPSPRNAAFTTPDEIAAAMRFLCSDEGAAVNGARLPLDGR